MLRFFSKESESPFHFDEKEIISECIDTHLLKNAEDRLQEVALKKALEALKQKQELSVDFIKSLHKSCVLFDKKKYKEENAYNAPEVRESANFPGEFRNGIVGGREIFTADGISEILDIIRDEKKKKFPMYQGTWIGPEHPEAQTLKYDESIHHGNIDDSKALQKNILEKNAKNQLEIVVLYPRTNNAKLSIKQYMRQALASLIEQLHCDIKKVKKPEEKIKVITSFIKKCLRLHPFDGNNHRVFALCVFNFLLLQNKIGYCPLKDRRQFVTSSLSESLAAINKELVRLDLTVVKDGVSANKKEYSCSLAV